MPSLISEKAVFRPALAMRLSSGFTEKRVAKTYSEKLLDPRWQRRRLEILSRSDFACEVCGDTTNTIHVHHRKYIKGREPWEYADAELVALCKSCHEEEHDYRDLLNRATVFNDGVFGIPNIGIAAGLLGGYLATSGPLDEHLRAEIRDKTGVYFDLGVAIASLGMSSRADLSRFIVEGHPKSFNMGPEIEALLARWESSIAAGEDDA